MDLFSKLPEKHIIRICYIIISGTYLVIFFFFAIVLFLAKECNAWTYFVLTGGVLGTLMIFAWILKGGMIGYGITKDGIKAAMNDGVNYGEAIPEGAELPVTQVMPLLMPIKNKKAK